VRLTVGARAVAALPADERLDLLLQRVDVIGRHADLEHNLAVKVLLAPAALKRHRAANAALLHPVEDKRRPDGRHVTSLLGERHRDHVRVDHRVEAGGALRRQAILVHVLSG